MTCYLVFKNLVKEMLKNFNVTDEEVVEILEDVENEVGHNKELIKEVVDFEREALIKRLKKKKKQKEIEMTYA